jgi:hypothetical protein
MKNWAEKEYEQRVYYDTDDGRIIGSVYKVGNNHSIWGAQVYSPGTNESLILGQYITMEYAKKGVENFWDIQSRTLIEDCSGSHHATA